MRFLRKLARYWRPEAGAKFLAYGRLLRPVAFEAPDPMPTTTPLIEYLKRRGKPPITAPALQTGAFQAPDGSLGVFIVNITEEPIEFRFSLTPGRYPVDAETTYRITRVDELGKRFPAEAHKGRIAFEGTVAGRDVILVQAEAVP